MASNAAAINTNAQKPKAASSDGTSVTQHDIPAQIAADQYERGSTANRRTGIGIRMHRTSGGPPGGS